MLAATLIVHTSHLWALICKIPTGTPWSMVKVDGSGVLQNVCFTASSSLLSPTVVLPALRHIFVRERILPEKKVQSELMLTFRKTTGHLGEKLIGDIFFGDL